MEQDADVYVAERAGVSWRMEEIREIERVARRRPLGAGYQIVVIEDVESHHDRYVAQRDRTLEVPGRATLVARSSS